MRHSPRFGPGGHSAVLAVLLGLGCAQQAYALEGGPGTLYYSTSQSAGVVTIKPEQLSTAWTRANTATGARLTLPATLPAPGGRQLAATLGVELTKKGVLRAAALGLSGVGTVVGAGMLAWEVYDHFRVRPVPAGLAQDPGEPAIDIATKEYKGPSDDNWRSWGAWIGVQTALINEGGPGICVHPVTGAVSGGTSSVVFSQVVGVSVQFRRAPCPGYDTATFATRAPEFIRDTTMKACQDGGAPGYDEKCPTGEYTTPISAQEAADIAASHELTAGLDYKALLDEALGRGPQTLPAPSEFTTDLPAALPHVEGPKVTTTHPDGSTTDTVTGWDWSRDQEKLDRGRFKETTTTTKKDATGAVIGEPEVSVAEGKEGDEGKDPCLANADRSGCAKFGEVADSELDQVERTVEYEADAGWGDDNGVCPVAPSFVIVGKSIQMDNTLFCDFFSGLRFVIIGIAGIMGALIFVGGVRE